ncbi:hypothetical protein HY772_05745 [Candidatus Woesearchaeota archaeon]|nr:hypothetical protein [Candidatus Woesearchaeota archaeon]
MKRSSLGDSFAAFVNHPKQIGTIFLFHLLFVAVIVVLNKLIASFFPNDQVQFQALLRSLQPYFIFLMLGMVAYVLVSIFIYSFFKYCIMDSISELSECHEGKKARWTEFGFSRLGSFFGLNLLIILIFSALLAFFSFLFIMSVRVEYIVLIRNSLLLLIGILAYFFIGVGHSFFFHGCCARRSMVKTYRLCVEKAGRLIPLLLTTIVSAGALWMLYLGVDWLLIRLFGKISGTITAFTAYQIATVIVAFLLAVLLLTFNQVYFFRIVAREEQKVY